MELLLDWRRIVDFAVLAAALYIVLRWATAARALRIALAVIALYAGVLFARQLDLVLTTWILQGAAAVALVFLVVAFQPEVRRALMRLDRTMLVFRRPGDLDQIDILSNTAFELAAQRIGALFVIVRKDPVSDIVDDGVVLAADISRPLIMAIFEKSSPLHDGAVLIEEGRVARASAVLPLTIRADVPEKFGTRHRAAMGLAERSDAMCIAVSEERGEVTVMQGRTFVTVRSTEVLSRLLRGPGAKKRVRPATRLRTALTRAWHLKLAAIGLASLIWAGSAFETSSSVRVLDVPIEFQNVPRGLDIVDQSATSVEVQVRGRTWLMDSNRLANLVARFDLRNSKEGRQVVRVVPGALNLPPGIVVKRVMPNAISVRLLPHEPVQRP